MKLGNKSIYLSPLLLVLAACQATPSGPPPGEGIGLVYMHGRGSPTPPGRNSEYLVASLESAGMTVSTPEMPWSGNRGIPNFSGDMDDAMKIVSKEVAALRAKGMKKIFVGGMSAGGNSAIAYGAHVGGIDGILAIAPAPPTGIGQSPEYIRARSKLSKKFQKRSIARIATIKKRVSAVRALIAAGKGDEPAVFTERNINARGDAFDFDIKVAPKIYFSYIDPKGKRAMHLSAKMMGNKIPLFLAQERPPLKTSQGAVYHSGSRHARSKLVELDARHLSMPDEATDAAKAWLLSFAPPKPKAPPAKSPKPKS